MGFVNEFPLREEFEALERLVKDDLARRLAVLDGNGWDKSGGQVGRLTAMMQEQHKLMGTWQKLFWIGIGITGGGLAGNIVFLREILHAIPK